MRPAVTNPSLTIGGSIAVPTGGPVAASIGRPSGVRSSRVRSSDGTIVVIVGDRSGRTRVDAES